MIELIPIEHGSKAPKADINVEIAHAYWRMDDFTEQLAIDFKQSLNILSSLRQENKGQRISVSLLIDDKRLDIFDKLDWLICESNRCKDIFSVVDYVTFESDLKNLLMLLYGTLKLSNRNAIETDIERYIKTQRKTACSHDIAIWHSMRLGALGNLNLPVYLVKSSEINCDLRPSFCASRVISILNGSDRENEERAEIDILKYIEKDKLDWRNIERYYY